MGVIQLKQIINHVVAALLLAGAANAERGDEKAANVLNQGVALFSARDYAGAEQQFAKAQALAPGRANPYRWLALSQAKLGRCGEAKANIETFVRMVPNKDPRVDDLMLAWDRCVEVRAAPSVEVAPPPPISPPMADLPKPAEPVEAAAPTEKPPSDTTVTLAPSAARAEEPPPAGVAPPRESRIAAEVTNAARGDLVSLPAEEPPPSRRSRKWLWVGLAVAGSVAVGLGVGLGVGLSMPNPPHTTLGSAGKVP